LRYTKRRVTLPGMQHRVPRSAHGLSHVPRGACAEACRGAPQPGRWGAERGGHGQSEGWWHVTTLPSVSVSDCL